MASRSAEDHQKYAQQRNKVTQAIREARHAYEIDIIQNIKQDPKQLFKYIRSQQKLKPNVGMDP